ncbi:MAG TPA: IS66 family transposase, partial [Terriglobales bacterium]|nr:IS66 family transposase [Terriglobales bacterium]
MATSKYGHHLPLYRLEQILGEQGCAISRKTLCDWVERIADLLSPVVAEQKRQILAAPLVQSDDTRVPYQEPGTRRGKVASGFLWSYTRPWAEVVYEFTTSRSQQEPLKFLAGYRGYLQSDAYAGYNQVLRSPHVHAIGCMAHVRRKFFEAKAEMPTEAVAILTAIQSAYRIERQAKEDQVGGAELVALRKQEITPILDRLQVLFEEMSTRVLPASGMGKAIAYALGQWSAIARYTDVAEAEIDNNSCEQTMRPAVLGRKNWLFAGSPDGGRRAAVIYSLVVTCRRLGIEPYPYLRDVL